MEDDNSMSERILRTLETIFRNDPGLKEFIIIPVDSNTKNKSPVLFQEHTIGLESWCIKHIYRYAYLELFEARKFLTKRKLSYYKEHNLNHLLIGVLLINPDVSTFWNMKRELVENEVMSVSAELLFTRVVLSYKSKSNEAFSYRRWLLKRILAKLQENDLHTPQNLLENELAVCEMAAMKNANNYHAWTHRVWCMENLGNRVVDLSNELEFSQRWISEHVSEHTGYHYRQYLFDTVRKTRSNIYESYYNQVVQILNLVNESDPGDILIYLLGKDKSQVKTIEERNNLVNFICLLLFDLYNILGSLNSVFPNHESMWYHRRYLLYHLIKSAYEYHGLVFNVDGKIEDVALYGTNIVTSSGFSDGETQPKLFKSQPNKVQSSVLYQTLVKNERNFIKTSHSSLELAKRHEKWLKFVLCWSDL